MRTARIKVDSRPTWYHCHNRTAGNSSDRPFDDTDKEQFVRIMLRVAKLYTVQIIAYQVMSNHFHILIHAPDHEPSAEEMCQRFKAFHGGKRTLEADSLTCQVWQTRSRDISWFMRHLQHLFTAWYNRTRTLRRRGSLWADRFKHTILESGAAAWACWKYIENNPVRAGMVKQAADYRFCTLGRWHQSGKHPFSTSLQETALPMLKDLLGINTVAEIRNRIDTALAEDAAPENERTGFTLHVQRRVRHWADGLIIGSDLFVRNVMAGHRKPEEVARHRVATSAVPLCAWRRVRATC